MARSGDTIFLFCKGADIALEPLLLKTPQNLGVWAKLSDHLHQFSLEGLRTLALGYRTVTENEYLEWAIRYAQALEGERDEELVDLLERELEEGLLALAVTAVEDRLQESVGETITAFRDRGIKFWMLTGDRRETAINVGYACGLLEQSTRLTILNRQDLIELQIESARKAFGPSHGLLLTGELLSELGENDLTLVLTFALECAAVIACRVSPSQKELLAGRVGRACTTLAVGDGANDVAMITRASVGVGIRGLEGGQAASSADYAIGEFRVLGELVLVWGPEVYRKNSYLIFYSLYKNMLLSLPLLFYAFLSNFSGFSYYNGWIFQFYNILFTSVPVLLLCSTDELSSRRHKLSHPEAYAAGPNDAYFNCWQGLRWAARVAAESAVLLFFIFYIEEGALCSEKRMFYATATGMTIFGCIVALTNLKILAAAHGLSLALLFSSFVSILCFYLVYLLLNFF